ncbi:diaminobutyrate acetyltransferase [Halarcobacter ebronensis]|uniref:diaminobutyrate acetyltransferase n=1 Tax=Halarcobacter ebronensis TaxID=1462615 RepID=UPI00155DD1E7|nr:diaminobutyrate acetyltransferase [Halarcobacter ebronensis]QKF82306.1 diaminobutanoate acetyltransferase [Halarcobacter ebronensis]
MYEKKIYIRKPTKEYSKQVFRLIKECENLDLNSEYLYLLQNTHFKESCSIAVCENRVVGFVSGYKLPNEPEILFIWQVAINEEFRGIGLANKLISNTLKRKLNSGITRIHTTVSPDNKSSIKMFTKLAKNLDTKIIAKKFFKKEDFINSHEEEVLYEIGPIKQKELK